MEKENNNSGKKGSEGKKKTFFSLIPSTYSIPHIVPQIACKQSSLQEMLTTTMDLNRKH